MKTQFLIILLVASSMFLYVASHYEGDPPEVRWPAAQKAQESYDEKMARDIMTGEAAFLAGSSTFLSTTGLAYSVVTLTGGYVSFSNGSTVITAAVTGAVATLCLAGCQ